MLWSRRESNPGPEMLSAESCHKLSRWMYYLRVYQRHPRPRGVVGEFSVSSHVLTFWSSFSYAPSRSYDDQEYRAGRATGFQAASATWTGAGAAKSGMTGATSSCANITSPKPSGLPTMSLAFGFDPLFNGVRVILRLAS